MPISAGTPIADSVLQRHEHVEGPELYSLASSIKTAPRFRTSSERNGGCHVELDVARGDDGSLGLMSIAVYRIDQLLSWRQLVLR
jgi:hypothetical protein